jgi:hypothetical protein
MTQLEAYKQKAADPDYFRSSGDGLLFACLQSVATGRDFDIAEYITAGGQVFRNPAMAAGTHKLGPRESTISRDMFMGLFCYCLHFGRADILQKVWSYGWRHGWRMGVENRVVSVPIPGTSWAVRIKDNRTWFTPGLILLLAALRAHLRGNVKIARFLVNIWQPIGSTPGYPSHLSMLHLYLNRRIRGNTAAWEHKVLDRILKHSPRNALALALRGWHDDARAELASQWPADRLPTRHDWTEEWRTQRADNDVGIVWGEPGNIKPHSGGDLLFVEHVLAL